MKNKRLYTAAFTILIILLLGFFLITLLGAGREEPKNALNESAKDFQIEVFEQGMADNSIEDDALPKESVKPEDTPEPEEEESKQDKEDNESSEDSPEETVKPTLEPQVTKEPDSTMGDNAGGDVDKSPDEGENKENSSDSSEGNGTASGENGTNVSGNEGNGSLEDGSGDTPIDGGKEDEGDLGNNDAPDSDEAGIITDLRNCIISSAELENDTLKFYVYYSDSDVAADIKVNYKHKNDSGNGTYLAASGIDYQTKLKLGTNYITVYYRDADGNRHYTRFVITYEAFKADEDNDIVGENPPTIETGLDNWAGPIKTTEFTLTVKATTWKNQPIYANHIEVRMDGKLIEQYTGNRTYEYVLYFTPPTVGEIGYHKITVLAWDDEGNSRMRSYNVEYLSSDEGDSLGYVNVVVDATTVGMGILDECTVELIQGFPASYVIYNALVNELGYELNDNEALNLDAGFFVRSLIRGDTFIGAAIEPRLMALIERDGIGLMPGCSRDRLGADDFTKGSGWMYAVNDYYPGKGLSEYYLNDGDTVYLRFTTAYGKDVGGSSAEYGSLSSYCGIWKNEEFIPLEHAYGEAVRIEPTESEPAHMEYTCSKCGDVKREEIAE